MVADGDWADDGVMQSDSGVVANNDVAYGIVDAAEGFYYAVLTKVEASIGWCVHTDGMVYFRTTSPMLVQWCQQSDVPPWPCVALVHDEIVE